MNCVVPLHFCHKETLFVFGTEVTKANLIYWHSRHQTCRDHSICFPDFVSDWFELVRNRSNTIHQSRPSIKIAPLSNAITAISQVTTVIFMRPQPRTPCSGICIEAANRSWGRNIAKLNYLVFTLNGKISS